MAACGHNLTNNIHFSPQNTNLFFFYAAVLMPNTYNSHVVQRIQGQYFAEAHERNLQAVSQPHAWL